MGVSCLIDGESTWVAINLEANNLSGKIPQSWNRFCTLTSLNLDDNALSGVLPAFGSEMAFDRLATLQLARNLFAGPLPDFYGTLSNLQTLSLSGNMLGGSLPESLACLSNLQSLELGINFFYGQLPDIFNPTSLFVLDVSDNGLSGPLPQIWNFTGPSLALISINLANNNFTGPIPPSLASAMKLSKLVLANNMLTGIIPAALARVSTISVVLLNNNDLEGEIPSFAQTYYNVPLTVLDVSENAKMNGTIGDDLIATAPSLAYISIKGNKQMRLNVSSSLGWFGLDNSNMDTSDRRVYYCPSATSYPPYYFRISTSPEFFGYGYCRCADNYYGAPPHHCGLCPANCECKMGNTLSWKRGFYPILNNISEVTGARPCTDYGSDGTNSACNPFGNCSSQYNHPLNSSCVLCSAGTEGRLCSHCVCTSSAHCSFRSGSRCIKCHDEAAVGITTGLCAFILGCVLLLVAFHIWRRRPLLARLRRAAREVGDGGALKIFVVFAQTTAMLNSTWPEWVLSRGMRYLDLFNASTDGTGIECVLNWMSDPVWNLATFFLIVPLATALIGVIMLARVAYLYRRGRLCLKNQSLREDSALVDDAQASAAECRQDTDDCGQSYVVELSNGSSSSARPRSPNCSVKVGRPWRGGVYAWLWVVWFLLGELTNRSLAVFDCVDEPTANGSSFMASLPWLSCSTDTDWGMLQKLSVASVVVYVCGIPLLFVTILYLYRQRLHDPRTRYCLGGLFACYRPGMRWFELAITARRLALPALLSLVPSANPVRPAAIMLVLLVALTLQHCLVPFASPIDNLLEEAAIGTVAFTFATQMLWKAFNQLNTLSDLHLISEGSDFADLLTVADDYAYLLVALVLVLNLVLLAVLLAFVLLPLTRPLVSALHSRSGAHQPPSSLAKEDSSRELVPSLSADS